MSMRLTSRAFDEDDVNYADQTDFILNVDKYHTIWFSGIENV